MAILYDGGLNTAEIRLYRLPLSVGQRQFDANQVQLSSINRSGLHGEDLNIIVQ